MQGQKFIAGLLWLLSATAFVWYMSIGGESGYRRNSELDRVNQTLHQVAKGLGQNPNDQALVEQAAKNLAQITDGAAVLELRALHLAALFGLLTLGFATLNLLATSAKPKANDNLAKKTDHSKNSVETFQTALAETMDELSEIKSQLQMTAAAEAYPESPMRQLLEAQSGDIIALESQLIFIKNQAEQLSSQNSKSLENLQRLSGQADDNSNYSAAARLEWNSLSIKLNQFRESQDKVRLQVEMLDKMQRTLQELLVKSLEFSSSHSHHSERGRADANRMYEESKGIMEIFGKLIHAMSESNGDVDLANKLVKGLSERAEEIVNIIDVIDDIAEQTNQLALNASIEAARAGEQGKGFAVVAAEVRHLAARSSTATRSITELLETIQAEASRASSCLEKTNLTVGAAHGRIVDVDHRCRETMNLSRQVAGELSDMIRISAEHKIDIQTIEKHSLEVTRMTGKLAHRLDDVDQIADTIHRESNQLAVHTDRLSRLMSRQYFAIQYSERVSAGQTEGFHSLLDQSSQLTVRTQNLRAGWEEQYRKMLTVPSLHSPQIDPARALSHRVEYCQNNLDIMRGRTRTLALSKETDMPLTDVGTGNDDIQLGSTHDRSGDDDINIDNNLEKAS
ncbi:MAG: hypothetical protein H7318_07565 [Oligoflexus sp.]|nr:hypothetical protein [Oligoflexus sp.]